MKNFCYMLLVSLSVFVPPPSSPPESSSEAEIKALITKLFDGMRKNDAAMVQSCFDSSATMQTVMMKNGETLVQNGSVAQFVKTIGTPQKATLDERITDWKIFIDGDMLASVWASYDFYFGDTFSHCGVDAFHLVRKKDGWKILSVVDTRRKDGCRKN
jgi:hypothetical protein